MQAKSLPKRSTASPRNAADCCTATSMIPKVPRSCPGPFYLQYRQDIDGLRAVAVIIILFYHAGLSNVPGGYIGVDVFFVISGFLITGLIMRAVAEERFRFSDFFLRRLRRLGPALLVTVAATLVAGWFVLPPNLYADTAGSAIASLLSVSNIYFWLQSGYFDTAADYKPLLHTWSLAVEEQFYLVWPAVLVLLAPVLRNRGLVFIIAALGLISLIVTEAILGRSPSAAFFLTPFRIYEFALGAVLALGRWQAPNVALDHIASMAGVLTIFYCAGTYTSDTAFPGLNAFLPALAAAAMIYAGPQAAMNRALSLAPFTYIGRISYSVYLVHWPLFVYAGFVVGVASTAVDVLVLIGLAMVLGAGMYHLVETPFRRTANGQFRIAIGGLVKTCGGATVAIVIACLVITQQRGVPQRFAPEMMALLADLDRAVDARTEATGEFSCSSTVNSEDVYFADFEDCLPDAQEGLIVVLGDSHAADVFMGLRAAFPVAPLVQLTGNGCNFTKDRDGESRCAPYMRYWRDWIGDNADRIAMIIYHQSGASLLEVSPGGGTQPSPALINQVNANLVHYAAEDVPFYIWGPRPRFNRTIAIAIIGSADKDALRQYYKPSEYRSDIVLDNALAELYRETRLKYLSVADIICTPLCPALTAEGKPYVVDNAHWSLEGATEAVRQIVATDPLLEAALTANASPETR
ncbi:MAG: acyltransferase family protein [Pseudomonadota bacterium]